MAKKKNFVPEELDDLIQEYLTDGVLTEKEAAGVKMSFDIDDEETGIKGIGYGQWTTGDIYDLSGRKINKMPKRGIYIVNGKKVIK